MSEKTFKCGDFEVNKKYLFFFKQPIVVNLVDMEKILKFDKFDYSDKTFEYFIGYKKNNIIRSLCIVLP